jgi:high affinity Mn2+ porin
MEQEITSDLGVFMRAGVADGNVEPYDYTDIDRTIAAGLSMTGKRWGRSDDTFGLAGIVNVISPAHVAFLNDGGLGILVGDGALPHPGPEQIIESYYKLPFYGWNLTFDYQYIVNPAYNRDSRPGLGLRNAPAYAILTPHWKRSSCPREKRELRILVTCAEASKRLRRSLLVMQPTCADSPE